MRGGGKDLGLGRSTQSRPASCVQACVCVFVSECFYLKEQTLVWDFQILRKVTESFLSVLPGHIYGSVTVQTQIP